MIHSVLDVAFTASIIRPADYKDTLDTLDFQIIASRLEPITKMWIPAGRTEVSPGFLVSPPVEKITPSAKVGDRIQNAGVIFICFLFPNRQP